MRAPHGMPSQRRQLCPNVFVDCVPAHTCPCAQDASTAEQELLLPNTSSLRSLGVTPAWRLQMVQGEPPVHLTWGVLVYLARSRCAAWGLNSMHACWLACPWPCELRC